MREIVAEPQVELEQESALGPACDVASLASLIMDLDVAALAQHVRMVDTCECRLACVGVCERVLVLTSASHDV